MVESFEVAVIGGGVMGAATAWALGRAGIDAVVLERFEPGHDKGSSHGWTRIFRFAYDDPFHVGLAQQSLPLWRELEAASGQSLLTITGGLDFGPTEYLSTSAAALRTSGAVADILDDDEVRSRFPAIDYGTAPALWSPDSGVLAASRCVETLREQSGVPFRFGNAVTNLSIEPNGHVGIQVGDNHVTARRAVVVAGAWIGPLLEQSGVSTPVFVSREQTMYFDGGGDLPVVIDRGSLMRYMVPKMHGAPGAKAGEHGTGERTTADGRSFALDPESQARVSDWIAASFPHLDKDPVAAETCLYTLTPDEQFIIDQAGPIIYASPCSGHGFKFAPLIGEALAALALDRPPPFDPSAYSAQRFG